MDWHPTPRDDAWKQAHLAMVERLRKRLWLGCDWCQRTVMVDVSSFAREHNLDMSTPLLTISKRLKCMACGYRRAHARPEPAGYGQSHGRGMGC